MEQRKVVRSYETDFSVDEDPISENGMWLNGKKDAIDFTDCTITNGFVHGAPSRMNALEKRAEQSLDGEALDEDETPEGDYDDPTAVLDRRVGAQPARQGHRPRREPDRGVVPGGPDPPPPHARAALDLRLRDLLPLPEG